MQGLLSPLSQRQLPHNYTMAREFTTAELAAFNGVDGQPVYVAIRGQVFDVTQGASFYGPGGPYEVFAGKECARALALMKISNDECSDDLSGLTDKQLTTLQDWVKKFTAKYPIVGKVEGSSSSTTPSTNSISRILTLSAVAVAGLAAGMYWSSTGPS